MLFAVSHKRCFFVTLSCHILYTCATFNRSRIRHSFVLCICICICTRTNKPNSSTVLYEFFGIFCCCLVLSCGSLLLCGLGQIVCKIVNWNRKQPKFDHHNKKRYEYGKRLLTTERARHCMSLSVDTEQLTIKREGNGWWFCFRSYSVWQMQKASSTSLTWQLNHLFGFELWNWLQFYDLYWQLHSLIGNWWLRKCLNRFFEQCKKSSNRI